MSKGLDVGGGSAVALGALALVGALVVPQSPLSVTGDSGSGGDAGPEVKDATLNLAASPLGSSTKVSTTAYATIDGTVVTKSLSSGQFTAWNDAFTNQDSIDVTAFDSSYYPIDSSINFNGQTTVNEEIKIAEIASASDVSIEVRDDGDSASSVDVAAGGRETVDAVRANVDTQDVYWNAAAVYVERPDNSNVTVDMPNAESIAVPDSAPDSVDKAFRTFDPVRGADGYSEFAEDSSSELVVEGDDSNDPSETLTVYVDDLQQYQSSDTGALAFGLEDDDENDLGLAEQSATLTVN